MGPVTYSPMAADTLADLVRRAQAGDDAARNHVIHQHLRIVIMLAHRMARRCQRLDAVDDMIQAAVAGAASLQPRTGPAEPGGMMRAIQLFDPGRKIKFSTYMGHWAQHEMRVVLLAGGTRGRGAAGRHTRIRRVRDKLTTAAGELPTTAEVQAAIAAGGQPAPSPETIAAAVAGAPKVISWDEAADNAQERDRVLPLVDSDGTTEADLAATLDRAAQVRKLAPLLARLPRQERAAVRAHFGLATGAPLTFRQVARHMRIPTAAVQSLVAAGLARLRAGMPADG